MKDEEIKLAIPDGLQIYAMEADTAKPFITFIDAEFKETRIDMPKQLAYYLTTHFCGSTKMRRDLIDKGRAEARSGIKP